MYKPHCLPMHETRMLIVQGGLYAMLRLRFTRGGRRDRITIRQRSKMYIKVEVQ